MSNTLSEIVANTRIRPQMKKAILREIADTVREKDLEPHFWRSVGRTALRIGTSSSVVSRYLKELEAEGLINRVGKKPTAHGPVIVYEVNLKCILSRPSISKEDFRIILAEKLCERRSNNRPR